MSTLFILGAASEMIFFVEQFTEAIPQTVVLLTYHSMYVKQLFNEESKDLPKFTLFWFTLSLSIISSSLGIIRFLMHGPCRLLPNYTLFGGYATIGFSILLINVITALIGKFLLAIGMIYSIFYGNYGQFEQLFLDGNIRSPAFSIILFYKNIILMSQCHAFC